MESFLRLTQRLGEGVSPSTMLPCPHLHTGLRDHRGPPGKANYSRAGAGPQLAECLSGMHRVLGSSFRTENARHPSAGKWRQQDPELEVSLGYMRACLPKQKSWKSNMAQWVKEFAIKPDNQSWTPRTHMEGEPLQRTGL